MTTATDCVHHYLLPSQPDDDGKFLGICRDCGRKKIHDPEARTVGNYMGVTRGKTLAKRACRDCSAECTGERCRSCSVAFRALEQARAKARRS